MKLKQALLLVMFMLPGAMAPAAEQTPEPTAGTLQPEATPAPAQIPAATTEPVATPAPKATAAAKSPDTFTPSEEISEDLSVSFPVDI